jgi:polar amino acid transport system substrate-binding protein
MKKKKVAALALILIVGVCLLSGCGTDTGTATVSETAEAPPTESTEIIMATNAAFPPFEYTTDKGLVDQFSGVDIAISMEIANALGKELVVQNMEFTSVLAAVASGSVDFSAAGMTANDERRQSMDFSIPYYTAMQSIIVKNENTSVASAQDIIDQTVGVVQGYTGEIVCAEVLKVTDLKIYKTGMEAVADLKRDVLDAVVIDSHTATAMVSLNSDLKIIEDSEAFGTEEYAIAVKKGNTELLETIDTVLEEMISSGKIDALVAEHAAATLE